MFMPNDLVLKDLVANGFMPNGPLTVNHFEDEIVDKFLE